MFIPIYFVFIAAIDFLKNILWPEKLTRIPQSKDMLLLSKKSPTGPSEWTPTPEYLIALAPSLGVRWQGPIQFLMDFINLLFKNYSFQATHQLGKVVPNKSPKKVNNKGGSTVNKIGGLDCLSISYSFLLGFLCISYSFPIQVLFISYAFLIHVLFISYSCPIHFLFISYSSLIHFPFIPVHFLFISAPFTFKVNMVKK